LHNCDQNTQENNLKEERLILAHGFRGFSPWLLGSINLGRTLRPWKCVEEEDGHLMVDRKQRARKGLGFRYDLFSIRLHLLKFSESPQIAPPAGDQSFNTGVYVQCMTFHIQIVTVPNTMFRGEAFGS
jgi:hypothetical protein